MQLLTSQLVGPVAPMDTCNTEFHLRSGCFSADEMPDWFLNEILLHLPVKSIFRFKCVSRRWRSLISDPSFAQTYTSQTIEKDQHFLPWTFLFCYMNSCNDKVPPDHVGLHAAFKLCHSDYLRLLVSADFPYLNQRSLDDIRLLACDNGLLLCCISQNWQEFYFVCNPLTLHWTALPRRPQLHKWVSIGFVVEPQDGAFQVARIAEFSGSSNVLDLETYTSTEGKWTERKLICPSPVCLFITHRQAIAFKGILHWREYNNRIIAYDPNGESDECRLIDMPRGRDRHGQGILRASQGGLYFFEICRGFTSHGYDLWELKDYEKGEWCLLYRISANEICSADLRLLRLLQRGLTSLRPLACNPFGSHIVYFMLEDRIACCDLQTRTFEIVQNDRFSLTGLDSWAVVPFVLPPWPTPVPQPS